MNEQRGTLEQYFDKDTQAMINEMEDGEMKSLLTELADTRYWTAIMKYTQNRLNVARNALFTLDPFKDPTSMARSQGIMSGMFDLAEAVILLKSKSAGIEKKSE